MKKTLCEELKRELASRGFVGEKAPHGSVFFDDEYFRQHALAEILELMVVKREKLFRSVLAIGKDAATEGYDDVSLVIDAVKAVLGRLEEQ